MLLFETPGRFAHRWIDMPFTFSTRYELTLYLTFETHSVRPREPYLQLMDFPFFFRAAETDFAVFE